MSNVVSRRRSTSSNNNNNNRLKSGATININNSNKAAAILTKPAWDSTHSDLTHLKLTKEEQQRRHQSHQSKNHVHSIPLEEKKQQKPLLKEEKSQKASAQLALLKEILFDENQLKDLILKSDKTNGTLKSLKDFFEPTNSQPRVKINMTLAPNVTDLNESNLPHHNAKPKQKSSSLQEFKPMLNNNNNPVANKDNNNCCSSSSSSSNSISQELNPFTGNDLQDCLKILSSKKRAQNVDLDDQLKRSLNELESKFNSKLNIQSPPKCESYTLSLIQMMSHLADRLNETRDQLDHEKSKQAESIKQLDIHRKLIDGLTNEIIAVKEQNKRIKDDSVFQHAKMQSELEQIKNILRTSSLNDLFSNQQRQRHHSSFSAFQSLPQPPLPPPLPLLSQSQEHLPLSLSLSSSSNSKFCQRLNAMLLQSDNTTNTNQLDLTAQIQKLKSLQSEQDDPLERLKREQLELREQINSLNEQRQSLANFASIQTQSNTPSLSPIDFNSHRRQ
jgi:hypothetical protein